MNSKINIKPLFIVGSPRSGTTFLTQLINRYFDIHVARDAGVILRFHSLIASSAQHLDPQAIHRLTRALFNDYFFQKRILGRGLSLSPEVVEAQFQGQTYAEFIDFIMSQMAHQQGKKRWGNKHPSYALSISKLAEIFPGIRVVHIVRDGRDVAYSMRRALASAFERNWYFAIKDWAYHVTTARQQGQQLPPGQYLEIRYEHLMQEPLTVLQEILTFIEGTPENHTQLQQYKEDIQKRIKPANFGKWKKEVPPSAIRVMERAEGNTLKAFNYPLMFPEIAGTGISPLEKVMCLADNTIRKLFSVNTKKFFLYRWEKMKSFLQLKQGGGEATRS